MAGESENAKLFAELQKYGVDLGTVVRDTHADTMIRCMSLFDEALEITIKLDMLNRGEKFNERMFKHHGELATLEKKINKAKGLNLIDDVARDDAHLLRKIRNRFAHRRERLHFDSPRVVEFARQLSTYEKAEHNQAAILAAQSNVHEQLMKGWRKAGKSAGAG